MRNALFEFASPRLIIAAAVLLPTMVLAQVSAFTVPRLQVLTLDQALQTLGITTPASIIGQTAQTILNQIGSRFMQSKGGDLIRDIQAKTGVDLVKFFQFIFQVVIYLFIQIYAVITDIATKLAAP